MVSGLPLTNFKREILCQLVRITQIFSKTSGKAIGHLDIVDFRILANDLFF